jgi:transmembrane sensor
MQRTERALNSPRSPGTSYTESQCQEAADWFVIIQAEDEPGNETLQAWLRWMDQNEGNRVAFESIAHAWHGTTGSTAPLMPTAEELRSDTYEGDQAVEEWLAGQTGAVAQAGRDGYQASHRAARLRRWTWLAVASLVAATLGLLTMNRHFSPQRPQSNMFTALHGPDSDLFMTKSGEQMEITLADGSRVWLGPKSTLQVGYTKERRAIQLQTGEAFFSVRKNSSRPFVVRSAGGDITAVGTAFNVRAVTDHVTVTVSEGVVSVAPGDQLAVAQPEAVRVASGQQLTFTAKEPVKALAIVQSATPGERARWRDGVLVYRDEPLRDVVMDVARYTTRQLEISGDAIGELRYSGVVYKNAVDEWTAALPESFPVKVVSEGNREVIVAR